MVKRAGVLALAGVLLVAVGGCSKVTAENYDKIKTGMTEAEVQSILGKGTVEEGGGAEIAGLSLSGKLVRWGDETKNIKVTFANGKVIAKFKKGL